MPPACSRLRRLLCSLVSLASLAVVAHAAGFHDSASLFKDSFHVHTLTNANFDHMLARSDEVWIVDFYAPWCPHCRDFAPELEKIGAHYANSKLVHVAAVDCTKNDAVCAAQDIMAYPAVKVFHVPPTAKTGTKFTQFGRKTRKVIVDWLEDMLDEADMHSGVPRELTETVAEPAALQDETVAPRADADANAEKTEKTEADTKTKAEEPSAPEEPENSLRLKYARLKDARAAALYTLETSIFAGSSVLEGDRYDAAVQWIQALAGSFPVEKDRVVFESLLTTVKARAQWEFTEWKTLIHEWKTTQYAAVHADAERDDEEPHWAHCKTYTCGLWTLIHSMTVQAGAEECPLTPSQIGAAIRLYILNFFGCEECAMHFARANPISVIDELAKADEQGNTALVVWMWRMHNIVNKVTKKQFWPSLQACPTCFAEGVETPSMNPATLRPNEIAAFITSAYEQRESDVWTMDTAAATTGGGLREMLADSVLGFNGILVLVGASVLVLVGMQRHRLIKQREHAA